MADKLRTVRDQFDVLHEVGDADSVMVRVSRDEPIVMTVEEYRMMFGDGGELAPKRKNKYNARKVEADGYTFDSQAEHRRYLYLKGLLEAGEITELEMHERFEIIPSWVDRHTGKKHAARYYTADFSYWTKGDAANREEYPYKVVEDLKGNRRRRGKGGRVGTKTEAFSLRWALVQFRYRNIRFREVEA